MELSTIVNQDKELVSIKLNICDYLLGFAPLRQITISQSYKEEEVQKDEEKWEETLLSRWNSLKLKQLYTVV